MPRRNFTKAIASSAIAWPLAVRAQQPDMVRRIGVLMGPAERLDVPVHLQQLANEIIE
jgi:hypothetical protein